jgi:signal transduction histidine kinase/HPt (histidine-containing phosphotransfer) domain-containing protein/ActR/RegA family two-component response regulator
MDKTSRFKFSSAVLTVLVVVLSFSIIIALWLYTEQAAQMRLIVFFLSLAIIVSVVVFIDQVQKKNQIRQNEIEQLVSQRTSELEAEKAKAEAARLQAEQINRQLQASISRADLMAQQAAEASRVRSEFLANTSHGIRTPMNAIIGFSEMLAEENLTEQQKKQAIMIRDSSRHLLHLITDILDFSKIEAGKLDVEITDCAVGNILAAVETLKRPAATEKRLQFEIIRSGPLPEFIRTDSTKLKQCLVSLVSNAIKFTDKGHIYVKVFWEDHGEKSFIQFDVEDTGAGISSEQQHRIFEPFSQASSNTVQEFGGTGLGLAITQHLAGLLGGSITVSSTVGEGSVFSLIIPTGALPTEVVKHGSWVGAVDSSRKLSAGTDNPKFHGRILIAEDSLTNQTLIKLLLERVGLEAVIVENGQQAVQKAMAEKFDIILMDIQMPVMNGYEATENLRKEGVKTPIVAVTACAMKGDDEKCFSAGCSDYLSKPIDRKKLVETLSKYLSVVGTGCCGDLASSTGEKSAAEVKPQETSGSFGSPSDIEIDWQLLVERLGSEELVDEIIPIFLKDNTERMKILTDAMGKVDQKEIKFYAHSIKGATATIGAARISELAKQLEIAARDGDSAKYKPLFDEINVRFARLIEFLSRSDWKQVAQQASLRQHTEKS